MGGRPAVFRPIPITDLHTHVLPGLDDGPDSFDGSIALLRQAFDGGTRTIVATPHLFLPQFDYPPAVVRERFADFQTYLADLSLDPQFSFLTELTVCLGAENHASEQFFQALETDSIITLNGTRVFLLEFPMDASIEEMKHAIGMSLYRGLTPLLAHLERYGAIRDEPERASELRMMGCVFQINAESVLRSLGPKRAAMALLKAPGSVVVASDAHGVEHRPANLHKAHEYLAKALSVEEAQQWVQTTPSALLGRQSLDGTEFFWHRDMASVDRRDRD
jgi:protein-tyrosine phosphatase